MLCIDGYWSNCRCGTSGTLTPKDNFGLVDLEAGGVIRGEARDLTDGAIDIDSAPTRTANEVVVVVPHPDLVAGW
jgi:hypothetical protein